MGEQALSCRLFACADLGRQFMSEKKDLEHSPPSSAEDGERTLQGSLAAEVIYHESDVFGQEEGHDVWPPFYI